MYCTTVSSLCVVDVIVCKVNLWVTRIRRDLYWNRFIKAKDIMRDIFTMECEVNLISLSLLWSSDSPSSVTPTTSVMILRFTFKCYTCCTSDDPQTHLQVLNLVAQWWPSDSPLSVISSPLVMMLRLTFKCYNCCLYTLVTSTFEELIVCDINHLTYKRHNVLFPQNGSYFACFLGNQQTSVILKQLLKT